MALVYELQTVEALQDFSLAGGTNLAIRFNHRKSVDIDLFTNRIIGVAGWENIDQALTYVACHSRLHMHEDEKAPYQGALFAIENFKFLLRTFELI